MSKYLDVDKLKAAINDNVSRNKKFILKLIDTLQQDKDVLDLCSQVWWEDRGWIMIPPNATLKGIESLLKRVRHKIKWNEENGIEEQEQSEVDLNDEISRFIRTYFNKPDYDKDFIAEVDWEKSMKECAHYFYELGKNARKEE